jgi:hypothetical protein
VLPPLSRYILLFVKKTVNKQTNKNKEFAGTSIARKEQFSGVAATGGDERHPTDRETDFAEDCRI